MEDLILCTQINGQIGEVNLEEPEQSKPFVLYAESAEDCQISFQVEERIYTLERDETAMLKRIQDTNIKAMGVDAFLGGLNTKSSKGGTQQAMSLDAIIDKKKVHKETKVICKSNDVPLSEMFVEHLEEPDITKPFTFEIDATASVKGNVKVCCNAHTAMPKGAFTLQIEDMSEIMRPSEESTHETLILEPVTEIVVRISKQVDNEGERLVYRLGEVELAQK